MAGQQHWQMAGDESPDGTTCTRNTRHVVETLIIGAGMSGVCMGVKLLEAGRTSFAVLERSGSVGGTWRHNRYPGCRCDVPSYLYCFSFDRNPRWSHTFAERGEIESYVDEVSARRGVTAHIRFRTEVVSATWDETSCMWHVRAATSEDNTKKESSWAARFLVRATGNFGVPRYPGPLSGSVVRERFEGAWFHSSDWPADADADVDTGLEMARDRAVAVVGTGASAVQIVPELARVAKKLYVCQRTPAWVLPKPELAVPAAARRVLARVPAFLALLAWACFLLQELVLGAALVGGVLARPIHAAFTLAARLHLRRSVPDPALRAALVPSYELGCKRILLSNSFYTSFTLPNVELVRGSVIDVRARSIVVSGPGPADPPVEKHVDLIVYATGFDMWTPAFPIHGRRGLALRPDDTTMFLGTTAHGFPNLFMLLGPNTGIGHTSQIMLIEAQARYILSCMDLVLRHPSAARALELRAETGRRFEEFLEKRLSRTVWRKGGCHSAYINPHTGRVDIIWPALVLEYMFRTRSASPDHYTFI